MAASRGTKCDLWYAQYWFDAQSQMENILIGFLLLHPPLGSLSWSPYLSQKPKRALFSVVPHLGRRNMGSPSRWRFYRAGLSRRSFFLEWATQRWSYRKYLSNSHRIYLSLYVPWNCQTYKNFQSKESRGKTLLWSSCVPSFQKW